MRKHLSQEHSKKQRGIAIVEFTLMVPVILLLMYSLAEVSRIQMMSNTLAKSVRDGARYLSENAIKGTTGVIDISTSLEIETKNLVVYGVPVPQANALLKDFVIGDVDVNDVGDNIHVRVTGTYNFTPIFAPQIPTFGITSAPISLSFPLQTSVTLRAL